MNIREAGKATLGDYLRGRTSVAHQGDRGERERVTRREKTQITIRSFFFTHIQIHIDLLGRERTMERIRVRCLKPVCTSIDQWHT